ncbi:hypothetical protein [Roseibium sp. RKSG952]|uniref:hypothetical protein n=1 Tax=Roseibium sp. RKSG952 TaxID=2529384 RepID=UPI0018AD1638|nr:hypothetical protein [Roseibium sp. RKSG952]
MKIGGRPALEQALVELRFKLRADAGFSFLTQPEHYLSNGDLCEFLVFLCGGAPLYEGLPVNVVFGPLCPTHDAFDAFSGHLARSVCKGDIQVENDIVDLLNKVRPSILPGNTDAALANSGDVAEQVMH